MLSDLFSALDCMQAGNFSFLMWALPVMMASLFTISSSWSQSYKKVILTLISINSETRQKALPGFPLMLFTLMSFLLAMNFMGLIPFVYGPTSNIWVSASLAMVFWSLLIFSGWTSFPKESAAHFAPAGAPSGFIPFLVVIETVSIFIRPLTLSIRIIANISAGHIIMALIATSLTACTLFTLGPIIMVHIGYNMFEIFVCSVQAYVFSLLVKLYGEEHPTFH
uniref:ATP synthase subunit a n=1 Tax=Phyllidiella pustulosa TaxID=154616 RepID=A0A6H0N1H1_9GAST|nr:ATP synthase F0 subunit 6 [Phyllidiella pustulosa]QIV24388.1 ATP synthase F0 subunit 6 [Phyllidiella pustulosa]UEX93282.1 ATP synthase F0 subunit 6 [Phyllidiella sp. Nanhai]WNR50715.1 ATP synthase F0 subunit 6 [Phyllidiella pustulosa]